MGYPLNKLLRSTTEETRKKFAELGARAQILTSRDAYQLLLDNAPREVQESIAAYNRPLRSWVLEFTEAMRRGLLYAPGFRLVWGEKRDPNSYNHLRKSVVVLSGIEADGYTGSGPTLEQLLHAKSMSWADIAKLPWAGAAARHWGSGRVTMKNRQFTELAKILHISPEETEKAFYNGCVMAAKANPDLTVPIQYWDSRENSGSPVSPAASTPVSTFKVSTGGREFEITLKISCLAK